MAETDVETVVMACVVAGVGLDVVGGSSEAVGDVDVVDGAAVEGAIAEEMTGVVVLGSELREEVLSDADEDIGAVLEVSTATDADAIVVLSVSDCDVSAEV